MVVVGRKPLYAHNFSSDYSLRGPVHAYIGNNARCPVPK